MKKDLGIGFTMGSVPGQTEDRHITLSARTRLSWSSRKGPAQGVDQ